MQTSDQALSNYIYGHLNTHTPCVRAVEATTTAGETPSTKVDFPVLNARGPKEAEAVPRCGLHGKDWWEILPQKLWPSDIVTSPPWFVSCGLLFFRRRGV